MVRNVAYSRPQLLEDMYDGRNSWILTDEQKAAILGAVQPQMQADLYESFTGLEAVARPPRKSLDRKAE